MTDATQTELENLPPTQRSGLFWTVLRGIGLLRESPVGMIGAAIVLFYVIVAILAPWITPYSPTDTIMPLMKPGAAAPDGGIFLLGTDHIGRDILSRLIVGTRRVLFYSSIATASAYVVGIMD